MKTEIYEHIDNIIERINTYKIEPIFSNEIQSRNNRKVSKNLSENKIIEIFTILIAYSQNANSKLVEEIINTGIFNKIFADFNLNKIVDLNPCDLADEYWEKIRGIRQQAKLFHIVSLARKIKKTGSFNKFLTETEIPKIIKTENDIDDFWIGFKKLKKIMEVNKLIYESYKSNQKVMLSRKFD